MTNPNDPARVGLYSRLVKLEDKTEVARTEESMGLTKREYFAGLALQGLLANSEAHQTGFDVDGKQMTVPDASVMLADFLILALNKIDAYSPQ